MPEPVWVREDVARAIHLRQLAEHGGAVGVRDDRLLQSALSRPKNQWAYSQPRPDLAALAASYAFGIIKNHAFVDGNKRTGYVVCRTFLLLNGHDIDATQEEKYAAFLSVAGGDMNEPQLARWIRSKLRRTRPASRGQPRRRGAE
jgi:death-on-curing protein